MLLCHIVDKLLKGPDGHHKTKLTKLEQSKQTPVFVTVFDLTHFVIWQTHLDSKPSTNFLQDCQ